MLHAINVLQNVLWGTEASVSHHLGVDSHGATSAHDGGTSERAHGTTEKGSHGTDMQVNSRLWVEMQTATGPQRGWKARYAVCSREQNS